MLGSRVREVLRDEGLRGLWIRGLGVTVYRRLLLFSLDLSDYPGAGRQPDGLEVGELDLDSVEEYTQLRPDTPPAEVRRRLRSGQSCLFVRRGERMVAARWIDRRVAEVEYLGLAYELPPGTGHLYDVYTAPEARRARIGRATFPRMVSMLQNLGVERLLVTGLPENEAGVGLIKAAGYEPVGRIGAIRIGPLRAGVRRIPPGHLGRAHRFHTG